MAKKTENNNASSTGTSASRSKSLSLKSLTKSSVWDVQENDIFRLCNGADKDPEVRDNFRHYVDIIRSAFMLEELPNDSQAVKTKYEKQGYKVGQVKIDEGSKLWWAVKKRPIMRVTDLTYENIRHISASKLVEVLDRNFGGGWESLSQSIKDIIESGFDISTTTLPKDRLHKKGGMYEKKIADGFDVLEVEKGTWVEAIFAKVKPEAEKPRMKFNSFDEDGEENELSEEEEEDYEVDDNYNKPDEDDVEIEDPNDDDITEDNYSTMMEFGNDEDVTADSLEDFADE